MGRKPTPDVACTPEQVTALSHVVATHRPPFADFAVWGPHGVRLMKKHTMRGLVMARDVSYFEGELYGPPSFGQWEECYDVLTTGLIMLNVVSRNKLVDYKMHIKELAAAYGPKVWHLLYQTDVRCRQELMHEIHQDLLWDHNEAVAAGMPSRFDPARPWDAVWSTVLDDRHGKWWTREFERPAQLILTHIASLESMLGGDVSISSSRLMGTHNPSEAMRQPAPPPRVKQQQKQQHQPRGEGGPKGQKSQQPPAAPRANQDGTLATNMKGRPLCGGFQSGNCNGHAQGIACPHVQGAVHQCAVCLSPDHGARSPAPCTQPQKTLSGRKGGGKGKGGKSKKY